MQIHELPDVTAIGSGGYFATDNGSQTTKIDYDALAKAIIEQYSGSTLAGSAQSVKAALNALNSNKYALVGGTALTSGADANTFTTIGNYYANTNAIAQSLVNFPIKATLTMKVESSVGPSNTSYLIQTVRNATTNATYERRRVNDTWTAWEQVPTRAEVDALSSGLNVVYGANPIKTLAATDDLLTLDVGMYRVANVLPLNAPSTTYKYGYATKQHRGASGYTYYEFIVGNGNGTDFKRYYGWQYSNSATSIDWIEMAPQSAVDVLNSNLQRVIPSQTSERGKTYAEHIQLQLDANNLPIGTPFFCAIDYYEKGRKPTAGFIYLASNQKYGSIAILQDNVIIVVSIAADVISQKTVSLS